MIERAQIILNRSTVEQVRIHPQDVVAKYIEVNQSAPENIVRMIMLYPNWRYMVLTPREVGQLIWYFDRKDPYHISKKLTQDGQARKVKQVAQVYLSIGSEFLAKEWAEVPKIESMIKALKRGEKLPPLIIVEGSCYPDSPDSSFVDGVHRSLAIVAYALKTPDSDLEVEAFVGRKASRFERIVRRLK